MKLMFKQQCRDAYTDTIYEEGKIYEFDDDRGAEILASGYVYPVIEKTEAKKSKSKKAKKAV